MSYTQISKPLTHWLANLDEVDGVLYIDDCESDLTADTICRCFSISADSTPEQRAEAESEIADLALTATLSRSEITGIVTNLHQQIPHFTQAQFFKALNFYRINQQFLEAGG